LGSHSVIELMTSYDSAARRAAIAYMRKVQFGWCEIGDYRAKNIGLTI
jgi:hypothetical protein